MNYKLRITNFVAAGVLVFALFILHSAFYTPLVSAQNCQPPLSNLELNRAIEGLVTTPDLTRTDPTSFFPNVANSSATCVVDNSAASFVPFKIPSYDELRQQYFTQSRLATSGTNQQKYTTEGVQSETYILALPPRDSIHNLRSDLNISSAIAANASQRTAIIFVEGNLTINSNIIYGTDTSGIVFVVRGNINIAKAVDRIDAVLIGQDRIITAYNDADCLSKGRTNPVDTPQLIINGNLVSLNKTSSLTSPSIVLCRWFRQSETQPAEKVIMQAKYLVILNRLFTQTLTILTEDTNYSIKLGEEPQAFNYKIENSGNTFVYQGTYINYPLTPVHLSGPAQTVSFYASISPPNPDITLQVNPPSVAFTNCSPDCNPISLRIAAGASVAPNTTYTVTVTGDSPIRSTQFLVTVIPRPIVTVTPTTVFNGQNINITYSGIYQPTTTDYLALHDPRDTTNPFVSGTKIYTSSCTGSPGVTPRTSGSCTMVIPSTGLTTGDFDVRLFQNDQTIPIGTSNTFRVYVTFLRVTPLTTSRGGTLTIEFTNGPNGQATDSLNLYTRVAPGLGWITRIFLNCGVTPPGAAVLSGTCTMTVPNYLPNGPFEVRLIPSSNYSASPTIVSQTITLQ